MGILDTIKKKIPAELFTQLSDALGDDFDDDVVPRSRLNKVIAERNELRLKVQPSTSDEDSPSKASGENVAPAKGLTQADVDKLLLKARQEEKTNAEKAVEQVKLQFAVSAKLRELKVKNPELLIPQLKLDGLTSTDVSGLDAQLTTWKTTAPYLFGDEIPGGTGAGGKGADAGELQNIQTRYADAVKAGNTLEAVKLKTQLFELQKPT